MATDRMRARTLGLQPGVYEPGPMNAIIDVAGVRVGHTTLDYSSDIHTGITAIVPDAVNKPEGSLPGGVFVGNGYGKLVGSTQLVETGEIETPILLTGTLSAFRVADALVTYVIGLPGNESVRSVNPIVGETNDGYLSDIRARPVMERHVHRAIDSASSNDIGEGCIGAGTGTCALGFKGGIGTSSRSIEILGETCTIGVLVQSNFQGLLRVQGVPIPSSASGSELERRGKENSCMIVVAVDRGFSSRQLRRLATRAVFGLARTGSYYTQGSGDYALAFATSTSEAIPDTALNPAFIAVQESVEEATLNSLFMATDMCGFKNSFCAAVSLDVIRERCAAAGIVLN